MQTKTTTSSERNEIELAVMSVKIANIEKDVTEIKTGIAGLQSKIDDSYVRKSEFQPVKAIVYGLVALILIAVIGAVVGLVILK